MFRSCSTVGSLAILLPNRSKYKLVLSEFEFKSLGLVTCYTQATHKQIYSIFTALRAPSSLTIIPRYTHIIRTAPSGLNRLYEEISRTTVEFNY